MPHEQYQVKPNVPMNYSFTFIPFGSKINPESLVREYN